jgi:hypothetical protein
VEQKQRQRGAELSGDAVEIEDLTDQVPDISDILKQLDMLPEVKPVRKRRLICNVCGDPDCPMGKDVYE